MPGKKKAKEPRPSKPLDPSVIQSTDQLLQSLGVPPGEWDVLLVGDGSGTSWNLSCGWACVLVDRTTGLRKDLHGGMNAGTSYLAELVPYVQALSWYMDGPGRAVLWDRVRAKPTNKIRVHIVSDCEILSSQGGGKAGRSKGRLYWSLLDALEAEGLKLHWHWMKRSQLGLNRLCDYMAGLCRKSIAAVADVGPPEGTSVYDFNADVETKVVDSAAGQ